MTAPTIVQSAKFKDDTGAGDTFTMGATPTNGNWLIAIGVTNGTCAANTGWTSQVTGAADNAGTIRIAFKLCSSESTSQTPFVVNTGVASRFIGMIWEVSGLLDGATFSNNVDATRITPATTITGSPGVQTVHGGSTYTPAQADTLVLAMACARVPSGNGIAPTFTNVGTWTQDQAIGTGSSSGNGRCGVGSHTVLQTSNPWANAAVNVTYDNAGGDTYDLGSFGMIALKPASSSTETGTAVLTFAGISYVAAGGEVHTGTGLLTFGGISFNAVAARTETSTASMAFLGIAFSAAAQDIHVVGAGAMAFGGISIVGVGSNLGTAGTGLRQFYTF